MQSQGSSNVQPAGLGWTPRESNRSWLTLASSADACKLVAGDSNGQLYNSRGDRIAPGAAGFDSGARYDALGLVYADNRLFVPLSHYLNAGLFTAF